MAPVESLRKPSLDPILHLLREFEPTQSYPRGIELYAAGMASQSVFILTQGIVRQQRATPDGRVAIVGLRTVGSIVGGVAALMEVPYMISTSTVTRCVAYRLSGKAFRALVKDEPAFSWWLHQNHAFDVQEALQRIAGLSCLTARERLEAFIDQITAALPPDLGVGEIPLRDRELAQLLAVTPPYLSRLIRKMIDEGRLQRVRGTLFLRERMAKAQ